MHFVSKEFESKKDKPEGDGRLARIIRRMSNVAESIGITQQHAAITSIQPKGSIAECDNVPEYDESSMYT